MQGSIQRVRDVIHGRMPDRAPLFELIRNDAVIERFTGRKLTVENAPEVVFATYEPAVDATRPSVRLPGNEGTETLDDGRQRRTFRWTMWTEKVRYADSAAYAAAKREQLDAFDPAAGGHEVQGVPAFVDDAAGDASEQERPNEDQYLLYRVFPERLRARRGSPVGLGRLVFPFGRLAAGWSDDGHIGGRRVRPFRHFRHDDTPLDDVRRDALGRITRNPSCRNRRVRHRDDLPAGGRRKNIQARPLAGAVQYRRLDRAM